MKVVNIIKYNTVEPVLKDHPIGHKIVVCQDRWSLVAGSVILKCSSFCKKVWPFKTGGLWWQWALKTGFTVIYNVALLINICKSLFCDIFLLLQQVIVMHRWAG